MNVRNCCTLVGGSIWVIAWTFAGSGSRPLEEMQCPRNVIAFVHRSSFSLFSRMPTSLHRRKKASRLPSCSFRSFPCMMMSSATQTTPVRPSRACSTSFWNISDDTLVPKGRRNHRYLPKHVRNAGWFIEDHMPKPVR